MVQSINTKALLSLASILRRPSLMVPHVSLENVSQLQYQALKDQCGIRAIIFDKDNTLTAPYVNEIHPLASKGLQAAQSVFGRDNVAILSNSAGTKDDAHYQDAQSIEASLGIAVIRHEEKKPGGLTEVLEHFTDVDGDPSRLCMVGDRLLTDVVFGNLYGMLTVHTLPLCQGEENSKDNKVAKVIRGVENAGLYGNWSGGRYLLKQRPLHKFWPGEELCPLKCSDQEEEEPSTEASSS